ncbi:histidine phosphatase family protein [Paenibacillus sp. BSR1-1]|uniref:histidine phosphatase family protein n=1 Tax=Paenibacillus sp. BSR1-1 TaxID=3020845 RepID=UPI0025B21780|nr:histidine phosphatase family protein [Paenibacillus sp. BSR1-1]MDN3020236.1 histidine phosphatase family protein [Paenibacillus sp. BSR1-1]
MTKSPKVTLYFVRHGETQFNVERRLQGFADSPLTEKGIAQARAVGKGLADIEFKAAYCSESQRVIDTATHALRDRKIPLSTDARLKEMNFGALESLLRSEITARYGNILETLFSLTDFNLAAPEGESYSQLYSRTCLAIDEILKNHELEGGNILVFSHGVTIGNYLMQLTNSEKYLHHDNCSVTVVSYVDGEFQVERVADTSFRELGQIEE